MKTFYSQNFLMEVIFFLFVLGATVDLAANPIFGPVQPFNVAFPVQQPNGQVRLEQRTVATMLVQWIAPQPIGRNPYGQIIYQNRQFQARYIIQIFAVPVGFNARGNMMFQPVPCPIGIVCDNGVAIATIPHPPVPQLEPIVLPPSPQQVQYYQYQRLYQVLF